MYSGNDTLQSKTYLDWLNLLKWLGKPVIHGQCSIRKQYSEAWAVVGCMSMEETIRGGTMSVNVYQ